MSWNVWGLKRKLCDADFISYVQNFDILLLGETWLREKDLFNFEISGYECDHVFAQKSRDASTGRASGGVSIYYKSCLKDYVSIVGKSDYGILWVKIDNKILESDSDAYICYIYVRDQKSQVLRHHEIDYFELLQSDISKYKRLGRVFVSGDFNSRCGDGNGSLLDHLRYDVYLDVGIDENSNHIDIPLRKSRDKVVDMYGRKLLDMCKATGLIIANGRLGTDKHIGEFTCVTSRGRSVIDYLLLAYCDFDCVSHFSICDIDEHSDHAGILFCLKLLSDDNPHIHAQASSTDTQTKKLIWSCENEPLFRNSLLSQIDKYDSIISRLENDHTTIDAVIKNFSTNLFEDAFTYFGKSFSSDSTQQTKHTNKSNPWFDNTCKTAKQNFNRAKHAYGHCQSEDNRKNLTCCRSTLNKAKRRAKAIYKFEHGKRIQNIAKTNSKKFWKEIKKFTKRKSKVSDKLTADDFLEHFSNVFQSNDSDNSSSDFGQICNSTLDSAILQSELKDVISSLKSDKSPGIDGLVAEIFKCSFDIISPLLLKLFNIIFLNGIYPNSWSEGLITPIHKKDSIDDANNYRGITLINILSKIYSHILNNRLLKWASENSKLSDCQFGFQKNKSTTDCIFIFHSILSKVLNEKNKLYCCFIDYQKAFDTVDRALLWQKLLQNGCSKIMLKALFSMYESIKSCVRYKNKCSSFFTIHTGVKQGDPLSPVLFIFFINDILESTRSDNIDLFDSNYINLFMLLYADDAVLFSKSPVHLQEMLNKLHEYSQTWGLQVNTSKTKIMIFEKGRPTSTEFY